VLYFN